TSSSSSGDAGSASGTGGASSSAGSSDSAAAGTSLSMKVRISPSGRRPMNWSTGWPLTNAMTSGMLPTWMCAAISGFSSVLIRVSLKRPAYSASSLSSTGLSDWQGPHQGAQNCSNTGTWVEASSTSDSKLASEISMTSSQD